MLMVCMFTQVLAGCKSQPEADFNFKYYYSFTDSLGNTVNLKDKPQRVVSLVGSYAETWILAGGNLVNPRDTVSDTLQNRGIDIADCRRILKENTVFFTLQLNICMDLFVIKKAWIRRRCCVA